MVAMLATSVQNQATLPILLIRGLSGIAQNEGRLESLGPVQHGCIAWTGSPGLTSTSTYAQEQKGPHSLQWTYAPC